MYKVIPLGDYGSVGFTMDQSRLKTISSIKKMSEYDDYNLYAMNVEYDYNIGRIIDSWDGSDVSLVNSILNEAVPGIPIEIKVPQFGCTAFSADIGNKVFMGRNYDFKRDTSAMMVKCRPNNGLASLAFCALDNLSVNNPLNSESDRATCLASPFVCLDGINEKGVSIAVLTLDSQPTKQNTGKKKISTSLAIRLVLDNASSVDEAVELFKQYDMIANAGRDYHFFVSDPSGQSVSIEYDCDSLDRPIVTTHTFVLTNFFSIHENMVVPNQKNGPYGHGKERFDAVLEELGTDNPDVWKALKVSSQSPNPDDITSNTQWSIAFDNTDPSAEICLRRHWNDKFRFTLT